MNLFVTDVVTSLNNKSAQITSLFTETVSKLSDVNDKALAAKAKNDAVIEKKSAINNELEQLVQSNNKFINRLESLFND